MNGISNILFMLLIPFVFLGCGETGSSSDNVSSTSTSNQIEFDLSGTVVDGKIKSATVCLDLSLNGTCDSGEPTTTTDTNGYFDFGTYSGSTATVSYIVQNGIDTATNKNFIGTLRYIQQMNTDLQVYITPLTDLIARNFFNGSVKNISTLENSKKLIAKTYNLTDTYISNVENPYVCDNPLGFGGIFARSQEIQQTKNMFQELVTKTMGETLPLSALIPIREKIKSAMLSSISDNNNSLDVLDALTYLEASTGLEFPSSEKLFVKEQLLNIKHALEMYNQYDLNTSDPRFDIYQKLLEDEADKAYDILNATDSNLTAFTLTIDVYAEDNTTDTTDTNTTDNSVSFSGKVVDGYISGARVCVDLDYDGTCDSTEPAVISDSEGVFTFSDVNLSSNDLNVSNEEIVYPIIASGGTDIFSQRVYVGELKAIISPSDLNGTDTTIISPLTDMVAYDFLEQDSKLKSIYATSLTNMATVFGVSEAEIIDDVTSDVSIFLRSMYLEKIKNTIKKIVINTGKYSDSASLRAQIKKVLYSHLSQPGSVFADLDVLNVLSIVALNLNITTDISQSTEDFYINLLDNLKLLLDDAKSSTDVGLYTLPTMQKMIEDRLHTIYANFSSADLNLTVDDIVYSEFDKDAAVFDSFACIQEAPYTYMMTDTNTTSYANVTNGLSIKSLNGNVSVYFSNNGTILNDFNPGPDSASLGFDFAFDASWINLTNNTVYIKTPQDENGKYRCYKAVLDSTSIEFEKVFRYAY